MPAAWIGAGAAVYGAAKSGKGGSSQQSTQQQIDPTLQALLYGTSANPSGLAQSVAAQAQQGQSGGLKNFGQGIDSYLGNWGADTFNRSQQNAQRLQESVNAAPQAANTQGVNVSLLGLPSQSGSANIDLSQGYKRFIDGDPGNNPYLNQALAAGSNQSRQAFNQLQQDSTRNLQENVLPGIRSGAIAAGGFGGSRQGIAEGKALGDFGRAQQNALGQYSAADAVANTGARANAYESGQNRSLSALQGLSGQDLQARLANQNAFQNAETTNAGLRQGVNLANLQSQLSTIGQNDARNIAGVGLSSGLLGQAAAYGTNAQNADWNKLLQGTGALGGLAGYGGSSNSSSPMYSNTFGNLVGGASAGLGLYNQFKSSNSGGGSIGTNQDYANNDWFTS